MEHELFDCLHPNWQKLYDTLRDAAEAANALPEYYDYMNTAEGKLRQLRLNVPDTLAQNRAERRMRERMSNLASRSNPRQQDIMDMEDME